MGETLTIWERLRLILCRLHLHTMVGLTTGMYLRCYLCGRNFPKKPTEYHTIIGVGTRKLIMGTYRNDESFMEEL